MVAQECKKKKKKKKLPPFFFFVLSYHYEFTNNFAILNFAFSNIIPKRVPTRLVLSFQDQHKIQFLSLSCYFFLIFAFKTYVSLKRFLLSAQDSFYIILSSYVEGHAKKSSLNLMSLFGFQASKFWKFFWKIYLVASFKIICQQK